MVRRCSHTFRAGIRGAMVCTSTICGLRSVYLTLDCTTTKVRVHGGAVGWRLKQRCHLALADRNGAHQGCHCQGRVCESEKHRKRTAPQRVLPRRAGQAPYHAPCMPRRAQAPALRLPGHKGVTAPPLEFPRGAYLRSRGLLPHPPGPPPPAPPPAARASPSFWIFFSFQESCCRSPQGRVGDGQRCFGSTFSSWWQHARKQEVCAAARGRGAQCRLDAVTCNQKPHILRSRRHHTFYRPPCFTSSDVRRQCDFDFRSGRRRPFVSGSLHDARS